MNLFGMKKKQEQTPADVKLQQIQDILFPPVEEQTTPDGATYIVDYSADINLEAALTDLEEDFNDETSRETIRKVANRLYEVRKVLDTFYDMENKKATYYVVDDLSETTYEKIQAASRKN